MKAAEEKTSIEKKEETLENQWELTGDCTRCRRKDYCKKPCSAHRLYRHLELKIKMMKAFPEEKRSKIIERERRMKPKMVRKRIKDVSFEQFDDWANRRACDGQWSMNDAMASAYVVTETFARTKHTLFFRHKKRNEVFKNLAAEYLNPEAEIEVEA